MKSFLVVVFVVFTVQLKAMHMPESGCPWFEPIDAKVVERLNQIYFFINNMQERRGGAHQERLSNGTVSTIAHFIATGEFNDGASVEFEHYLNDFKKYYFTSLAIEKHAKDKLFLGQTESGFEKRRLERWVNRAITKLACHCWLAKSCRASCVFSPQVFAYIRENDQWPQRALRLVPK